MTTFTAASLIPAFDLLAADFGKTVQDASYLVSFAVCSLFSSPWEAY